MPTDFNDLAGWIFVFLIFFGGGASYIINNWISHRREIARLKAQAKLPPPPPAPFVPPDPICGCTHSLAFHPEGGRGCTQTIARPIRWEIVEVDPGDADSHVSAEVVGRGRDRFDDEIVKLRIPVEWESASCPCVRYVGPEPMLTLTAPDLSNVAVEQSTPSVEPPPDVARPYGLPSAIHSGSVPAPAYESTFTYDPPREDR